MTKWLSGGATRTLFVALAMVAAPWVQAHDGSSGGTGGAEAEVHGVVQAAPASGLLGDWTVAGRTIHATAATVFDQSDGAIGVGAVVEVKGATEADGSITATKIDVDQGVAGAPVPPAPGAAGKSVEFTGAIQTLPAGTLLGTWTVAGQSVVVVSTTRLEQEHGGFAVGAIVEVHGSADSAGLVTAADIELKSGGAASPVPPPQSAEIHGTIEALPASGLIGDWTVTGRKVTVTATTSLDSDEGTFVVGDAIEVKGAVQADGSILAAKIEREDGNGGGDPALEFTGAIEVLPSGTTGVLGVWQIGGTKVNVTAATQIDTEHAPLAVGTTAEVKGWLQADGVVEAQKIETQVTAVAAKSGVAVEFFNASLGHFFISASAAETAALDAGAFGGQWARTGQTFNVGGATSVCRFYGMPPRGPDSHFFTADAAECQKVMQQLPAWTFEGHAFATSAPVNGACPANTVAVQRLFNNPTTLAAINHRFTTSPAVASQMVANGWVLEGVVMCAPL